jgi:LytR cell envelope-related transcriptional attenuator
MKSSRAQFIVLSLALLLVGAFVVSFVLGLGDQSRGITVNANTPPVPGINSGRRVEVLNGSGRSGLARQATDRLRAAGFDVVYFGNAAKAESTSIALDRMGKLDIAQAVANALGITRTETRRDSTRLVEVSVILGSDWQPPGKR